VSNKPRAKKPTTKRGVAARSRDAGGGRLFDDAVVKPPAPQTNPPARSARHKSSTRGSKTDNSITPAEATGGLTAAGSKRASARAGTRDAAVELKPIQRAVRLAERTHRLARRGVFLGTSSWKYPGWLGQIYDPARYDTRGKFSQKRFDQECLVEYARVFPAVGGDFSFYQFPSAEYWDRLFAQTPPGFQFGLKIPEEVTVETFPRQPRYGQRAGQANPHFMDAAALCDHFLARLEPHRAKVGTVMFEFGRMYRGPLSKPEAFVPRLDAMLGQLPRGRFRFSVEIRNANFLASGDAYLACLRTHGVAHVLNSWTHMPAIEEQLLIPGILTAKHVAARFLLRPGRSYQQAVDAFEPYEHIQDPYPEGRAALTELIERCLAEQRMLFAFVNNRFEGNAPQTIEQALARIG